MTEEQTHETEQQQAVTVQQTTEKRPNMTAGGDIAAIVPQNLDEAWRFTDALCRAGMIPASYEVKSGASVDWNATRARLMIGVMKSMEVGFAPLTGLSNIAVINNRPCIWGDGAVALVQQSGKLASTREWFEGEEGSDDWTAHCEMRKVGQAEPYVGKFSVRDAKRAKLWANAKKAPWMLYPQRMLMWRARTYCIRNGFAECLAGLSIAEEIRDITPEDKAPGASASFLDDDAPEDAPALEYQPNPEATAYRAATEGKVALSAYLESLDDDARDALPVDELFAVAEAADNEREADADPSEDAEAA